MPTYQSSNCHRFGERLFQCPEDLLVELSGVMKHKNKASEMYFDGCYNRNTIEFSVYPGHRIFIQ